MIDDTGQSPPSATPPSPLRRLARAGVEFSRRLNRGWRRLSPRGRRLTAGLVLGAVGALAVGLWGLGRRAALVAVNVGGESAWLSVDDGASVELPPTSVETPGAGVELALAPGEHRLVVRVAGGAKLDERRVNLAPHGRYLYAPVGAEQCFWVQTATYGQAEPVGAPLRALPREQRVWALPAEIDAWFAPNPPPDPGDTLSTGGVRVAVRQGRCGFPP
jgi:hypothetical protein